MNLKRYFSSKNVLITGGLGFLGSNLAHALARLGSRVTVLDCLLDQHGGNPFNIASVKDRVRWVQGDIRNASLLKKILKGQDFLFNIAAQTSHTDSMDHPFLDVDINTQGQITLLETCRILNPKIRIVYCSTRAVYGSSAKKVADESLVPHPLDVYSANKLAGEHYHTIYSKVYGLNATVLRVANGYGPRAQMKAPSFGILNWFIRLAIGDQEIKVFGDGKQVRDYVYVDDIVQAFLAVASRNDVNGETFNVGSGKGVPLIDIVKRVVRYSGKGKIVYVPWPAKNKKIDVGDFIANVDKIKSKVGWQATISLDQGLQETIDFYERYQSHYW